MEEDRKAAERIRKAGAAKAALKAQQVDKGLALK